MAELEEMSPNAPLTPRPRAVIVGASSGIGAALARRLADEGYQLALLARREPALARLREQINNAVGEDRAVTYPHDVTRRAEIPALFQELLQELRGIDLIAYTAGVMPGVGALEFDPEKDRAMVEVNLLGAMAWLGQAATLFARMGAGQIVGISSVAGDRGRVKNPGYNASKAGLDAYLEGLRNRLSRLGVRVLTVKPGFVDTAMLKGASPTFWVRSPDQTAADIWKAIQGKKQLIYTPARWRWMMLIIRHIPSFIFRRLSF